MGTWGLGSLGLRRVAVTASLSTTAVQTPETPRRSPTQPLAVAVSHSGTGTRTGGGCVCPHASMRARLPALLPCVAHEQVRGSWAGNASMREQVRGPGKYGTNTGIYRSFPRNTKTDGKFVSPFTVPFPKKPILFLSRFPYIPINPKTAEKIW
jgi:hypothetical protein